MVAEISKTGGKTKPSAWWDCTRAIWEHMSYFCRSDPLMHLYLCTYNSRSSPPSLRGCCRCWISICVCSYLPKNMSCWLANDDWWSPCRSLETILGQSCSSCILWRSGIQYNPSLYSGRASDARIACLPSSGRKLQRNNKSHCVLKHSFLGVERWKLLWCSQSPRSGERTLDSYMYFPRYISHPSLSSGEILQVNICFRFGATWKQRQVRHWRVLDTQRDETDDPNCSKLESFCGLKSRFLAV